MTDIRIDNLRPDLKQKIEELARAKNHSFAHEAEELLERGLVEVRAEFGTGGELAQSAFPIAPKKYRVEDFFPPRPEGERGLGSELAELVPEEYWDDDLIQPRQAGERPPPDFR